MSAPPSPRRSSGPRCVVIGAGAIGLSCALALAREGGDVTVVEADSAGGVDAAPRAASYAAAGMLGAFSEALHEGPGHHRKLSDLCALGLQAWRTLGAADPSLARFVRFPGTLLLAHDEADAARVRRACDRAQAHNSEARFFDGLAPDLDARLFGTRVAASAKLAEEGVLAPSPMMAALSARIAALGGSILRGRNVAEIVIGAGAVKGVEFDEGGGLSADAVVIATGALAPTALRVFAPALKRLKPAKGALGVVAAPATLAAPEVVRTTRVYFVREGAEIRFGATMEVGRTDLDEDPEALAGLHLELKRAVPGVRFSDAVSAGGVGLRPMTPDGAPMVGPAGPAGCYIAAGHGRNGWLLAPVTGTAIAAMVLGVEAAPLWSSFGADRFR
ncbi:MAG: FAD-binding oxidoreductase [Hyphomonadaceae bacterium]|nr:FAD-binding oxidoreductase [Hyphomonadaceae bacterium]